MNTNEFIMHLKGQVEILKKNKQVME